MSGFGKDKQMKKYLFPVLFLSFMLPATAYAAGDTYISQTARSACIKYGDVYAICPELLMSVTEQESSGNAGAENGNCKGLMQVDITCHTDRMDRLGCTDLFDEAQNIHVAADYLSELFQKYEDIYMVLMCYNMGETAAGKLFAEGIYVSDYAVEVCGRAEELERLHGK